MSRHPPTRRAVLRGIGAGAALAGVAGVAGAREGASAEKNLVEKTIELNDSGQFADQFDTLIAAVEEAGLVGTLTGNRQLTVFAPTDEGFEETLGIVPGDVGGVDDTTLVEILTYHVSPGRRYAASVLDADRVPTLNGAFVEVDGTDLNGDQADILVDGTDIEASNGVIHAIEGVLLPP